MPGRGAAGRGAPGARCCASFAARSGLGGTTGRALGCPARFGFAGGRSGPPPPTGGAAPALGALAPGPSAEGGRGAGRAPMGAPGTACGRGAPGAGLTAGFGISAKPGGRGWRGPERICPGLGGGGAGLDGMTVLFWPGVIRGGVSGGPPANGGRMGGTDFAGAAVSTPSFAASAGGGAGTGAGSTPI